MNFSNINIQDLQIEHTIDVNPSTGSASATVNIPSPKARAGFNPTLTLHYTSSSKNSIFGMGWSMEGFPFVSLDTSKGFPQYDGSDGYAFNGSNALVPQLKKSGTSWVKRIEENASHWIYCYRSKYESSFIRFEKWVNKTSDHFTH